MKAKTIAVTVAREPATQAPPLQWPRWVQIIRRRIRRAICRHRYRAKAGGTMSERQLQELATAHTVRKAFFSAEAQMGMFR